jgi:hypothetical protein
LRLGAVIGVFALVVALTVLPLSAQNESNPGTPEAQSSTTSQVQSTGGAAGDGSVGVAESTPESTATADPTTTTTSTTTSLESGDTGSTADTGDAEAGATGTPTSETGGSSDGTPTSETDPATPADPVGTPTDPSAEDEPVIHQVGVTVYDCETDPGVNPPQGQADCVPVEGAVVNALVEQEVAASVPTDASGLATLDLEDGDIAQIRQEASTITQGYMPVAGGVIDLTVTGPTQLQLVNVLDTAHGRLQVASGECLTSLEPHTEFVAVIEPSLRAASTDCWALGGAEFTITGGGLGEPLVIVTDGSGNWTGYLDPGSYQIARNGATAGFALVAGDLTAVVAVDYIAGPMGTLSIQRYVCSEGEANGTTIEIDPPGGGGAPDASCILANAQVVVTPADGLGEPLYADLPGGSFSRAMAAGQYTVTDGSAQASLEIAEGAETRVLIVEIRVHGSVAAELRICPDPSSNFEDAGSPEYWASECQTLPPGTTVSLLNAAGEVVNAIYSGSGGSVRFEGITPGVYRIAVGEHCAIFANGVDARQGFRVEPREVVQISAYRCAKPSSPPSNGGGNSSGGGSTGNPPSQGGDTNTGGQLGAVPQELFSIGQFQPTMLPVPEPKMYVNELPAVGTGDKATQNDRILIIALATGALALGGLARRRQVAQSIRP